MSENVERPECVTEDMLYYLDDVRDSGMINMFGAASYVRDEFGLSKKESRAVLSYWMQNAWVTTEESE